MRLVVAYRGNALRPLPGRPSGAKPRISRSPGLTGQLAGRQDDGLPSPAPGSATPYPEVVKDLSALPDRVRSRAIVLDNGEVMWPFDAVVETVTSMAAAGGLVVGLDLRSDGPRSECQGLATEVPVAEFKPSGIGSDRIDAMNEALAALRSPMVIGLVADGYAWVLITWTNDLI